MPAAVPTPFTAFKFDSPEEEKAAMTFSGLNLVYLMNLRSEVAIEKINLKYDPEAPHVFQQNEAALTGKLNLLNILIGD